ncbi:MAG TPA: outer membrane protein transport protein [Verrucomicrobiae bacterium]|nr:outer membrane protein transport protein [Verrucomicrobiae bacterium]
MNIIKSRPRTGKLFPSAGMTRERKCPWQHRQVKAALVLALLFSVGAASKLGAVGARLPNQDPEGIARGDAFAATADNPSAIYYNPAGITQLEGVQVRAGLYLISADSSFTSPTGAKAQTDTSFQPVPQLYAVDTLQNLPLSFGLGVYAPYGLAIDWGDQNPFRTVVERGRLLYACVNPVIAWRIVPTLSVAIGPTINYSQASFKQGFSAINPNDFFHFKGDDVAFGFNAGIRWEPLPQLAFGVNYRSSTTEDYHGTTETGPTGPFPYFPETPTSASIYFPQYVAGGISYRPTKNWNVEFDLDWTEWSKLKQVVFKGTPLGNLPLVLNYKSSFMYEFGVTRQLGKGYFASVGYLYSENSSPDQHFNPIIPDANLQLGSVGVGHRGTRWDWAVGYQFAYNGGRQVSGNVNPMVDGTYKTFNNAVNISATLKF